MIVQRLTFSTGNQTLPVVDESDLFLTDNIERAAVRHWILDGSENQYISKVKRGTGDAFNASLHSPFHEVLNITFIGDVGILRMAQIKQVL